MNFVIKKQKGIVALTSGNVIYVHPNLNKYPEVYKRILNHELEHIKITSKGNKQIKHMVLDATDSISMLELKDFFKENPDSFKHFLPINKIDGVWRYNLSQILYYVSLIIIFLFILWGVIA